MPKQILVIEDDDLLGDAYRLSLEDAGFAVVVTRNATEALKVIDQKMPDLIILDLLMPQVDGFALLQTFQQKGIAIRVPIIVATNLNDTVSVHKALALGARDYFVKSEVLPADVIKDCCRLLKIEPKA